MVFSCVFPSKQEVSNRLGIYIYLYIYRSMSLLEVTPHAYPAYKEEAGIVFSFLLLLCVCFAARIHSLAVQLRALSGRDRRSLSLAGLFGQEHHFGSPLGSPVAYQARTARPCDVSRGPRHPSDASMARRRSLWPGRSAGQRLVFGSLSISGLPGDVGAGTTAEKKSIVWLQGK